MAVLDWQKPVLGMLMPLEQAEGAGRCLASSGMERGRQGMAPALMLDRIIAGEGKTGWIS